MLDAPKPATLSFAEAGALPLVFLSAYLGLRANLRPGGTVYIPGGGGGVGHLAVQMAARTLGAGKVYSSAGSPESIALARSSGAHEVLDYKRGDVGAELRRLTDGKGVDLVFDPTYNETSYVDTARMVAAGGTWVVLGVGPGKTTRAGETESPVDGILAAKDARHVNANLLRFFTVAGAFDDQAEALFREAMASAMSWAANGRVLPHVGKRIDSSPAAINAELAAMAAGRSPVGKVVVVVDPKKESPR